MNIPPTGKTCPSCTQPCAIDAAFCPRCGHAFSSGFSPSQPSQYGYGQIQPAALRDANSKKITAGICGIVLGSLGVHKFVLGYNGAGMIMLLASILTCGIAAPIMHLIGLVEGILYLTKSDDQFWGEYMANTKEWF